MKKPSFWIVCLAGILYLAVTAYIAYYHGANTAVFFALPLLLIFNALGIDIFIPVGRREVFKAIVVVYVLAVVLYFLFNENAPSSLSANVILGLVLFFLLVIFISGALYFLPSRILECWGKRKRKD